jgi:hypothetical protein
MRCGTCGAEFEGRRDRRYCSVACRRAKELLRRDWDRRASAMGMLQATALMYRERGEPEVAANWERLSEEAAAALPPRP